MWKKIEVILDALAIIVLVVAVMWVATVLTKIDTKLAQLIEKPAAGKDDMVVVSMSLAWEPSDDPDTPIPADDYWPDTGPICHWETWGYCHRIDHPHPATPPDSAATTNIADQCDDPTYDGVTCDTISLIDWTSFGNDLLWTVGRGEIRIKVESGTHRIEEINFDDIYDTPIIINLTNDIDWDVYQDSAGVHFRVFRKDAKE